MTETIIQKHTYMPGLDGLRALAVFAVIGYHLNLPFVSGGFLGVTLFFVLSGYLITDLLLTEWHQDAGINFKRFFIRRAKRLLPSVLFILICLTAYATVFRPDLLSNLKSDILPSMFFFSNWWYIFTDVPYFASYTTPSLLTHFWSLAVEAQFYLIWPVLVLLGQRFLKKKWIIIATTSLITVLSALLMAVLFEPGGDPSRIYYGTDTRAFSLLLGALLAYVYPSTKLTQLAQKKMTRTLSDVLGFVALALIIFMSYYITQYDDYLYYGGMFAFSVISVVLIAAAANPLTIIGKVFSLKPLKFIGKISYGIYLWHFPVIALTNSMIQSTKINVVLCVLQVAASILLAAASYYLIENPIRRYNILESVRSLKSQTFKGFCTNCHKIDWRTKTGVLLTAGFISLSGIGMFAIQAVPVSVEDALSSMPTALVINPSDTSESSSLPEISEPSPEASTPAPDDVETAISEQETEPITSSAPDTFFSSVASSACQENEAAIDSSPTTTETTDDSADSNSEKITLSALNVTLIGDSIGIGITPYLQEYYPNLYVNAEVSRQFSAAKYIVEELLQNEKLGPVVVIELGTNGAIAESHLRALIEQLGSDRTIVFVNIQVPRSWCEGNNATLTKITEEYPNAFIADWYSASIDNDDYFCNDDVHPSSTGAPVFSKLIYDTITDNLPSMPHTSGH